MQSSDLTKAPLPTRQYWQLPDKRAAATRGQHVFRKQMITINIARIANSVKGHYKSVDIVVLNCQKCNQCFKGHNYPGLLFEGVL